MSNAIDGAETRTVVIRPPAANKPGYLKRRKQAMQINKRLTAGDDTAIDDMVEFVLKNATVIVPEGVDAREAIMDLSEEAFARIFNPEAQVDPQTAA